MEEETARYRRLNDEWLDTLDEVRNLPELEFRDFLRPKSLGTLQQAARHGPVIFLNTSASGCDALIISLDGVKHLPLHPLSSTLVETLVLLLRMALSDSKAALPESIHVSIGPLTEKARGQYRHVKRFQVDSETPENRF